MIKRVKNFMHCSARRAQLKERAEIVDIIRGAIDVYDNEIHSAVARAILIRIESRV